jgi:HPt (histidine-containing phosphotransfer) domain-containing protein
MTAHAMKGDHERCLEHDMDDYIAKPVRSDALLVALEKWLPRKTQAPERRQGAAENARVEDASCAPTRGKDVSPWDRSVLLERLMGDEELVAQLVEAALDDLPRQVGILKDSLAAADNTTSERQAHSIKGAAANIGAEPLRNIAERMERAARRGDLESCRDAFSVLGKEFEELRREMERYRGDMRQ